MVPIPQSAGYGVAVLRRTALIAACAAAALAGCGSKPGPAATKPAAPAPQLDPPQAAEPVAGPVLERPLSGLVVQVGKRPEGIAIDPRSHVAAVAVDDPPRLVLLSTRSGRKLREVRLPSAARHVALAAPGGPFLVPAEDADTLVEVSVDGGDVRTTKVGENPHDATALGPRKYVVDEFSSTMSVVRDGRLVGTVPVDAQPGGVAQVGGKLYVNAVRAYTVEAYAPGDEPRGEGAQSSGLGPSHVIAGPDGRIAIGDTRGHALVVYDTRPRVRFRARVALAGTPVGLAWDGKATVWVTLSERNSVVPVDLSGAKPRVGKAIPTPQTPLSAAVDTSTGRLAVAGAGDGSVRFIDP